MPKSEFCQWCKKEKTLLPDPTDHGHPVFVCTEKVGKQKMPCDGFLWTIVAKRYKLDT